MSEEREKILKRLKELAPEELESVSGGGDPFADVHPFYLIVHKNGEIIDDFGISFSEYWRTLGYVRAKKASYYHAAVNSFHFYKRGTRVEYNYDLSAKDNGIAEYEYIDAYIE